MLGLPRRPAEARLSKMGPLIWPSSAQIRLNSAQMPPMSDRISPRLVQFRASLVEILPNLECGPHFGETRRIPSTSAQVVENGPNLVDAKQLWTEVHQTQPAFERIWADSRKTMCALRMLLAQCGVHVGKFVLSSFPGFFPQIPGRFRRCPAATEQAEQAQLLRHGCVAGGWAAKDWPSSTEAL